MNIALSRLIAGACLGLVAFSSLAQSQKFEELENTLKRRYATVSSDQKIQPSVSVNFSDYFPQYGFPISWDSTTFKNVALFSVPGNTSLLGICVSTTVSILNWDTQESTFGQLGYSRKNFNCTGPYTPESGLYKNIGYSKLIDITRVVVPSSLPEYVTASFSVKAAKESISIAAPATTYSTSYNSTAPLYQSTCAQGSLATKAEITTLFQQVCASLTPAEQANQVLTYGIKLKQDTQTSQNFTASSCALLTSLQNCTVSYTMQDTSTAKRHRFYGPRFVWKQYVYVTGPGIDVESFLKEDPHILGIFVK